MNEKDMFIAALQKSRAERPDFLDRACQDERALKARIEVLLEAHDLPGGMLDLPQVPGTIDDQTVDGKTEEDGDPALGVRGQGMPTTAPEQVLESHRDTDPDVPEGSPLARPISVSPGSHIGPYKLLREIGEGGMGAVYLAEQEKPVRRRVALKIIKPGMDSDQVIARFEAERQALALMDHPRIAKIFDAGTTDGGRPYFVMELVDGIPITEYCDQARLSTTERLELFITVCQAVQHAHQKGVIHRDIKPSNVLVTRIDGTPVPKVIDFGVAKAIDQRLSERTQFTQFGAIVGTLEYMSPEQAELGGLDIDTRADIYALGVMLYELLTGSTPLDRARLREVAYVDILRRIKEEDPPRPSTRLSGSGNRLGGIAAHRRTEPGRLTRAVRGDLDWIVMKALEKDRTRRYETANGFARDIRRFLNDEAVEASPPSASYRFRKFLRRNKGPAATASLLLLTLLSGIVGTTVGLFRAERSREQALAAQKAESQLRKTAEASERQAREATNEARTILSFLQEKILSAGRPEGQTGGLGKDVTLRQALDAATPELPKVFADRPVAEASISRYIGDTYTYLGEFTRSLPLFERALELRRAALGDDHPDALVSMQDLGDNYLDLSQESRALPLFEEMKRRRTDMYGPDHELTLHVDILLGRLHLQNDDIKPFLPVLEHSLEQLRRNYGPGSETTRRCMSMLGHGYLSVGQPGRAVPLLEQVVGLTKAKFGPEHMTTYQELWILGLAYFASGMTDLALSTLEKTLEWQQAKLDVGHPNTLGTMHVLALCHLRLARMDVAVLLLEQGRDLAERQLGPDHRGTQIYMADLGWAYLLAGTLDRALPLLEYTLEQQKANLRPHQSAITRSLCYLGCAYGAAGKRDQALAFHERAMERQVARFGFDNDWTLRIIDALGRDYLAEGKMDRAMTLFQKSLELRKAVLGSDHPDTLQSLHSLGFAHLLGARPDLALPLLEHCLASRKSNLGNDHPDTLVTRDSLGRCWLAAGQPARAESILRECLSHRERKEPDAWSTYHTRSLLGASVLAQRRHAEAEWLLTTGYEGLKVREARITPSLRSSILIDAAQLVVRLFEDWGKGDQAAQWRIKLGLYELPDEPFAPP